MALNRLKGQLAQVDALIKEGVLTGVAAHAARADLERQLLAAVLNPAGAPAAAAAAEPRPSKPPPRLMMLVAAFVLVFGAIGYGVMGNRDGWQVEPGMAGPAEAGAGASHEQVEDMIAKLVKRLEGKPEDADGWAMLGRTYAAQGRAPESMAAFKRVVDLKPKDAQALADYADAMAVVNGRSLDGEPEKLIFQAVQLDPGNVKALALAGTIAFNRSQFADAVVLWERAVRDADPAEEFVRQLQGAIDEARRRGGEAKPGAGPRAAAPVARPAAATAGATVSGRVSIKPAVRSQVSPDDTVFILARAPAGSKMPLAILRKKVSDLPMDFSLDDSQAMSPASALSTASQVVVVVRISKSGTAMPGPGDWQVMSAPVALGAKGIQLELGEPVK